MDYGDREIETGNIKLVEFIRKLAAGDLLIPTFQRLFVWDPDHVINLWDSIYRRYPIGSILCWKTHVLLHVHRQIGGFVVQDRKDAGNELRTYILDGQQRATSLLSSFYGGTGRVREQYSFDYTLYFDSIRAEFFFEKDYYRHRRDVDAAFLIRLKDVLDLPADYCESLSAVQGFSESADRNLEQLQGSISGYGIPVTSLEGYDISDVCGIYERINQTGMRLTNMDILIARGFKNYSGIIEEDFPVS